MKEEAADNRSVSEKFADCLILGDSITQGLYEYGVLDEGECTGRPRNGSFGSQQ